MDMPCVRTEFAAALVGIGDMKTPHQSRPYPSVRVLSRGIGSGYFCSCCFVSILPRSHDLCRRMSRPQCPSPFGRGLYGAYMIGAATEEASTCCRCCVPVVPVTLWCFWQGTRAFPFARRHRLPPPAVNAAPHRVNNCHELVRTEEYVNLPHKLASWRLEFVAVAVNKDRHAHGTRGK